ncbi:MAG: PhoH family protein [Candidatus Buchananbacteria bacterium]|nr:PhoH family protein [Candidatus Buchananbacteria bacterium]
MPKRKVFVLDTSVLVHDPSVIENLGDNIIVIPIWSIEELDRSKSEHGFLGASSREVSRKLDSYRETGSLKGGVPTSTGGRLFIDYNGANWTDLPVGLEHNNDNRILLVAMAWQKKSKDYEVILLTKDINLRIKANACGVFTDDYKHDRKISRIEELYCGRMSVNLDDSSAIIFHELPQKQFLPADIVTQVTGLNLADLPANIGCKFIYGDKYILAVYNQRNKTFDYVPRPKRSADKSKSVKPINDEQALAFRILLDPYIRLVTLVGKAGTGKTLISLLAAWRQLGDDENKPSRILVWRPNVEIGKSLGFLPGDIDEKFAPWREPICENMKLILGSDADHVKDGRKFDAVGELIRFGQLEIQPINYALGATKHNAIILIDEAQNLTPREVAALITRCGDNSKVIITGDPYQIYNPYLDPASNGLTYVVERFRGYPIFGHITMLKSERSELAELAADIL